MRRNSREVIEGPPLESRNDSTVFRTKKGLDNGLDIL
jgi:hypothetical protein